MLISVYAFNQDQSELASDALKQRHKAFQIVEQIHFQTSQRHTHTHTHNPICNRTTFLASPDALKVMLVTESHQELHTSERTDGHF